MKTRYSRTARRGGLFSSFGRLAATVIAIVVFLTLLLRLVAPGALITLAAPVWRVGTTLDTFVGGRFSLMTRAELTSERNALAAENESLRNQNATLAARSADLERLLGGRTESLPGVLAGVLARPPVAPYDTLVVDAGTARNVTVGDVVLGPGGAPAGSVTEANADNSRVTLYSAPGRVTDAWIGVGRIPVRLAGAGAGAFESEIPGTAGAAVGDLVYIAGPGALPVGTVAELLSDLSSPTVGLRIKPVTNPFSLTWVTITPAL